MEGPILIYGAGSLCRVVESMINDSTNNEIFIFDSNIKSYVHQTNGTFSNKPIDLKDFISKSKSFVVAIGNEYGFARYQIGTRLENDYGLKPFNLIADNSFIDKSVEIGNGNIFMPGVSINKFVKIGNYNIFGLGSNVDHETEIYNGVHIMGSSLINGRVKIMNFATIGSGSVIFPDITIKENVFVGSCSMVNKEFEEDSIIVGSPAKFLRKNERRADLSPFESIENTKG
ncbi:MAG: hypothetical protein VX343_00775 [Thermodesulfobacteriota bacterium]|nr:hypothetical protein [Thermodesulfobacteriota bacterium]